jgi:hypothetical protein
MAAPLPADSTLTLTRLTAEIDRRIALAIAGLAPAEPVAGSDAPPRQHLSAYRPSARFGLAGGDAVDTQTWHHVVTTETPPAWVRLVWPYDRPEDCDISGYIVAPSASVVDPLNPVDGDGDPVAWITGTTNNAGLPLTLAEQLAAEGDQVGADDTTGTLFRPPVNGSVWPDIDQMKSQKYFYGDWLPVKSLPRTDVPGGFPVIMHRVKFSGVVSLQQEVSDADHALMGGRLFRAYANAGDCVTTPASFVSTTKTAGATPIIQYITAHKPTLIAVSSDSTHATPGNHVALSAYALSTVDNPVEFLAGGTGGFDAEAYCGNMLRLVPHLKPAVVFIEMRSANGIASVADTEADWTISMVLAEAVSAYGGVPVLMTPLPCPTRITTAEVEASRLDVVARCLAAESAGARVLDLNGYFTDGATPIAGFRFGSDDGIHLTPAGQSTCASELTTPFLRTLLGI